MGRNDWPVIIGFGNPKGLPFPVEVLPQQLRQYVHQAAEAYQVPADLPGCLGLAVIAASNAMSFEVQLAPDWKEPCNLYVAVVMPSGQRKSAVFRSSHGHWRTRRGLSDVAGHSRAVRLPLMPSTEGF